MGLRKMNWVVICVNVLSNLSALLLDAECIVNMAGKGTDKDAKSVLVNKIQDALQ